MKCRIKDREREFTFEPFTLEIDIESESDLLDIYSRMSPANGDIKSIYTESSDLLDLIKNESLSMDVWNTLRYRYKRLKERIEG